MSTGITSKEIWVIGTLSTAAAVGLIGGGLYFKPGTVDMEGNGNSSLVVRMEPITVPAVRSAMHPRGIAHISIQFEVADAKLGRDACYYRPRIQDLVQTYFNRYPIKEKSVGSKRLLKKVKKAAGGKAVKAAAIVQGVAKGRTVSFPKTAIPSSNCRETRRWVFFNQ